MTNPNPPATLEEISDRLAAIERLLRQVVYPRPPREDVQPALGSGVRCNVCGLIFNGPMGYVCQHPDCPSRLSWKTSQVSYPNREPL